MNVIDFRNALRKRQAEYQEQLSFAHSSYLTDIGEIVQAFIGNADIVDREYEAEDRPAPKF